MVDITKTLNLPSSLTHTITVKYALFLPKGQCWVFDRLDKYATCERHPSIESMYWSPDVVYAPLDLIAAARLGLIKRGDDSGIGEEQWAWMNLIGLTGEKTDE